MTLLSENHKKKMQSREDEDSVSEQKNNISMQKYKKCKYGRKIAKCHKR